MDFGDIEEIIPQSRAEIRAMLHELTHLPYRTWRRYRVMAKARHNYHKKQMQRINVVQLDFGQIVEDDICLNVLLITDGLTAAVAAIIAQSKAKD